jgi:uncharacterized RDD family membrane protein YckC
MTFGEFDPDIPVGEPGGYQAAEQFSPPPPPMPVGEFNPNAPFTGRHSKEDFGQEPAGLGIRAAARAIDGVICVIVAVILAPKLPARTSTTSYGSGSGNTGADTAAVATDIFNLIDVVLLSMTIGVVSFVFFMIFESALGWTPGKKLMGLSVHASSRPGAPKPGPGQAANRNSFLLLLLVPIPYLSWLFLMISCIMIALSIFNSSSRRSKHDLRAGTEVLKGRPLA